jgi:CHAT domain-containing protein
MPFHAAGMHCIEATENAYSRTVSSYAPSIKALAYAREQAKDVGRTHGSLFIATMLTTPALEGREPPCNLPGVRKEKDNILELIEAHFPTEGIEQPSVSQVIEGLQRCSIARFACHGSTDHLDPSKSRLILQKQDENQKSEAALEQDWLTVRKISELNLPYARMAYLSACSTAQNRAAKLQDEAIHVVSGFQVAGFPHVVGCLWPSIDSVSVDVASQFYSALFRQGGALWERGEVALALREAVMLARAEDIEMPLVWAQFVHYGP